MFRVHAGAVDYAILAIHSDQSKAKSAGININL